MTQKKVQLWSVVGRPCNHLLGSERPVHARVGCPEKTQSWKSYGFPSNSHAIGDENKPCKILRSKDEF